MSALKRKAFIRYYLGECQGNATQAAIKAGYSEKTAKQQGHRLLTRDDVSQAIQRHAIKADVTAERVIKELALIAFSDVRGLFDEHGHLRPVHELPEDVARALASVEVAQVRRSNKSGESLTYEQVKKVKSWDKTKALEMLGRHLSLWQDRGTRDGRITVNIGFLQQPGSHPPSTVVIDQGQGMSPGIGQGMSSPARVALPEADSE